MAAKSNITLTCSNTLDAELIALGDDLESAFIEYEHADEAALETALIKVWGVAERIAAFPARTSEGRKVKALAAQWAFHNELRGESSDARILRSLLADLLAA